MARVKANTCECDCKMKRLYTRAEGGKGWDAVGWLCDCGCLCMDAGEWKVISCEPDCCEADSANDCCPPQPEPSGCC